MAYGLEIYEADGTTAYSMHTTKPIFILATFRIGGGLGYSTTPAIVDFQKEIDGSQDVYWMSTTLGRDLDFDNDFPPGGGGPGTGTITNLLIQNGGDWASIQTQETEFGGFSEISGCLFVYRE